MDRTLALVKAAKDGDRSARDTIVSENTGLVWSVVRRFLNRGYDADDLFQIGAIGLIKCIEKFDLSFDVKFSTYAVPMIMGEIKRFLRDDGMIKVSRSLKETANKARFAQERMIKESGRNPSLSELAATIDTAPEELAMALEAGYVVESLYQTVNQGQNDASPVYLIDKLELVGQDETKTLDIIAIKEAIAKLKPKERKVIMLRYYRDKTQSEVAKEIGVSQVQVSRIEKRAIEMIRGELM